MATRCVALWAARQQCRVGASRPRAAPGTAALAAAKPMACAS